MFLSRGNESTTEKGWRKYAMSVIATLWNKVSNKEEKKGERTTELHKLIEVLFYYFGVLYVSSTKSTTFYICLVCNLLNKYRKPISPD